MKKEISKKFTRDLARKAYKNATPEDMELIKDNPLFREKVKAYHKIISNSQKKSKDTDKIANFRFAQDLARKHHNGE